LRLELEPRRDLDHWPAPPRPAARTGV